MANSPTAKATKWLGMLVLPAILSIACNNPPGALELALVSDQGAFAASGPYQFVATFRASEGRICIDHPRQVRFDAKLTHLDSGKVLENSQFAYCGMTGMLLLPVYPLLITADVLDVGDAQDRFAIVSPERAISIPFILVPPEKTIVLLTQYDHEFARYADQNLVMAPGRYRLCVTYSSSERTYDPAPLFWRTYSQSVSACTEFVVSEEIHRPESNEGSIEKRLPVRETL
jgi:hypothetical protein